MKKYIVAALLSLCLPALVMAAPTVASLNARADKLGLPHYGSWAWESDGKSVKNSFWAGYEGLIDMCENYLTPANLANVIAKQAYSAGSIDSAITGQTVEEWKTVNPW